GGSFVAALEVNAPRGTLYLPHPDGTFTTQPGPNLPAGFLYSNIASDDLDGNGLGALVVTAAASGRGFVAFQTAPGVFGLVNSYAAGVNPSDVELADVNHDPHPDVLLTDRFSGQVSVLVNQGNGTFFPEEPFRAGTGLSGLADVNGTQA